MNELIKELAEQCESFGSWDNKTYSFDKEKFAELLIKECGHCMVDIMLYGGIEPEQGYDIMLKHFGVKE